VELFCTQIERCGGKVEEMDVRRERAIIVRDLIGRSIGAPWHNQGYLRSPNSALGPRSTPRVTSRRAGGHTGGRTGPLPKEGPVQARPYHKNKPTVTEALRYGESGNHQARAAV